MAPLVPEQLPQPRTLPPPQGQAPGQQVQAAPVQYVPMPAGGSPQAAVADNGTTIDGSGTITTGAIVPVGR